MKYLVTIYIDEKAEAAYTKADWDLLDAGYAAFDRAAKAAGVKVEGYPLEPASTATTVRVREGRVLLTDGPFAETKEQLGGFCVIEAPGLDEVLALVKLMPGAQSNCVEVRAIAASSSS